MSPERVAHAALSVLHLLLRPANPRKDVIILLPEPRRLPAADAERKLASLEKPIRFVPRLIEDVLALECIPRNQWSIEDLTAGFTTSGSYLYGINLWNGPIDSTSRVAVLGSDETVYLSVLEFVALLEDYSLRLTPFVGRQPVGAAAQPGVVSVVEFRRSAPLDPNSWTLHPPTS